MIGKWVLFDAIDIGEICWQSKDEQNFLIRFNQEKPNYSQVFNIQELATDWVMFFDDAKSLYSWLRFFRQTDDSKVIPFRIK